MYVKYRYTPVTREYHKSRSPPPIKESVWMNQVEGSGQGRLDDDCHWLGLAFLLLLLPGGVIIDG